MSPNPVHFPANPDKFEFDGQVSAIFDNMADRSIPNFREAHAAHARMLKPWLGSGARVLDIGASRGAFLKALKAEYPYAWSRLQVEAYDVSPDMCAYLRRDFTDVQVEQVDLLSDEFLFGRNGQYDVVCVNYVLQFLPAEFQPAVLDRIIAMVRNGGVQIWGHKSQHHGKSGAAAHEEYIRFRMQHGYSREEIEAKTAALKASMHPMDHTNLMNVLNLECSEVTETFRYMMFSTIFAVK